MPAKDPCRAFELNGKAAALGDLDALLALALCHLRGLGTYKDPKRAVELLQKAVDGGNVDAISHLGACFHSGVGGLKDEAKAMQVLERGANQNDAPSLYELAQIHSVAKNSKWLEYARRAVKLGHADALLMLGVAYQ